MADNENATTEQQPQPTGGTTVNVTVQYPGGQKPVKKVTYVLLAFFLGGLGIHNFYAGRTGLGVLYLIFCWTFIPAIAAFVQAIIALCKTGDCRRVHRPLAAFRLPPRATPGVPHGMPGVASFSDI